MINRDQLTVTAIATGLEQKQWSAKEITQAYLSAIADERYNCFLTITPERALAQAAAADKRRAENQATSLTGVPLAVKDVLTIEGIKTTAGSSILQNYKAAYTATAVDRLEQAGMVTLGKTNCDEFAMGSSNENSAFGKVLNPLDPTRVPGGSSGGSAAAVAADLAPVALGTDTGGSVRQPASFCGLVGLKPTYGRISRYGLISMTSSFDTVGIFSHSVEDCALLLQTMAGADNRDATSSRQSVDNYFQALRQPLKKLKVGLPKQYYIDGLDERIRKLLEQAVEKLRKHGVTFTEVDLPYNEYALATYYVIAPSEISSNLSRYDGLRYGFSESAETLLDSYKKTRSHGFGAEVKRRVILGTFALSAGYYQAYYLQAQKVRSLIKQDYDRVFKSVDLLLTPTSPTVAFKLGERINDPLSMYLADIFTVPVNITGIPGLSLPAGLVEGLPAGLQFIGPAWSEKVLLQAGKLWQSISGYERVKVSN